MLSVLQAYQRHGLTWATLRGTHLYETPWLDRFCALFRRNLPNTPTHLADMRHLTLGRRFVGLLAWDSFFHLSPDDQRATLPRFAAHAAPGAPLMFTSGDAEGEAVGDLEGTPLYHGSLDPAEYRARLRTAGFTVLAHATKDPACGHRTIWLAQRDPA